jgi:hypothetical protein
MARAALRGEAVGGAVKRWVAHGEEGEKGALKRWRLAARALFIYRERAQWCPKFTARGTAFSHARQFF